MTTSNDILVGELATQRRAFQGSRAASATTDARAAHCSAQALEDATNDLLHSIHEREAARPSGVTTKR